MARTPSRMVPLGTPAPAFELTDTVSGQRLSLEKLRSDKATVVMFLCNHCPFVKHINSELVRLANSYLPRGISFLAISSNDVENYPEDRPELMKSYAESLGYPFPYLYDETQEVAKAYQAECTPDFFIYDKDLRLIYRGQFDDSRPGLAMPVTGKDIRAALDSVLAGEAISIEQNPSLGCNIKWRN